jgi:hypothetical protein
MNFFLNKNKFNFIKMGNENSQITFPIEGNNNLDKIRIKYKKTKSKEISKNNDKIISK